MDDESKELLREALALYKRYVESLERARIESRSWQAAFRGWMPILVMLALLLIASQLHLL